MHPLVRFRKRRHHIRNSDSRQVDVSNESVEAAPAVVVDAQPHHVPTRMIRVTHAKDWKGGGADRIARTPGESQSTALSIDISRRPVGHQLAVGALEPGALRSVRNYFAMT